MANQYLLPCSCGEINKIETSQAGQVISCDACGVDIELPSLLKLKQLESVSTTKSKSVKQNYYQAIIGTAGIALFILAAIGAGILFYLSNQSYAERTVLAPDFSEKYKEALDKEPYGNLLKQWEVMKTEPPRAWRPADYLKPKLFSDRCRQFAYICVGLALFGILMTISTPLFASRPKKRRKK